jgi:uncharacterized membrane protein (DUF485 family)
MNTATEHGLGVDQTKWDSIAASEQFQDLLSLKKLFIVPALLFFLAYYISLSVLVGYAPSLIHIRVLGTVNFGYLFALSQFVVGWIIAGLYLIASARFDRLTKDILTQADEPLGGK